MTGLLVSWIVVFAIAALMYVDQVWNFIRELPRGTRDVILELGGMEERIRSYVRAYFHTGRHRRDNPPRDSEVDSWPGADEEFVDTLRGMNAVRV